MTKKGFLTAILTAILYFSTTVFATLSGSGTETTPYLIQSRTDFNEFADQANAQKYWAKGIHTKLMCNIDFAGANLKPIGCILESFAGMFDGNNKELSNFNINQPERGYVGLFGFTSFDSVISNLGLKAFDISGSDLVGGLVAYNYKGTIRNCYAVGIVNGRNSVGGLMGSNNQGKIITCWAASNVTSKDWYVGGLTGDNYDGTISNCYSTGAINGFERVGGLVGFNNQGTINNCYSTATVTGKGSIGGLVGLNHKEIGVISNCYFYLFGGPDNGLGIALDDNQLVDKHCFAGFDFAVDNSDETDSCWIIDAGYMPKLAWQTNSGFEPPHKLDKITTSLTGSGYQDDPFIIASYEDMLELRNNSMLRCGYYHLEGDIDLGKIVYSDAFIPEHFHGTFNGNGHSISNLTLEVDSNYAGLFSSFGGSVDNLALLNTTINGKDIVGGLAGYSQGVISNCYATGTVSGNDSVGGLVGYSNQDTISNCYSAQTVTGSIHIGGIVGLKEQGSTSNCYFYLFGGPNNGLGTALDDSQLVDKQCFTGFDFAGEDSDGTNDIWLIEPGYMPRLTHQDAPGFEPPHFSDTIDTTLSGSGYMNDPYIIASYEDMLELRNNSKLRCGYYSLESDIDLAGVVYENAFIPRDFSGIFNGNGHCISNLTINAGSNYVGLIGCLSGTVNNLAILDITITGYRYYVGGLAGYNQGTINNCCVRGATTGSMYIGGLIGKNDGVILTSYSTGTVDGDYYVGGLAGYNSVTISNSYAAGVVSCNDCFVGGLVGENRGQISKSYSAGKVWSFNLGGGLVGYNSNGTISGCFWDTQTSDCYSGAEGGSPEGVIGKTTDQMQTQSTFTDSDWDFVNTWSICEGINYPKLQWQRLHADFVCPDGVNLGDFAYLAGKWMNKDCGLNQNCGSADLNEDGTVGPIDLIIFADNWLQGI